MAEGVVRQGADVARPEMRHPIESDRRAMRRLGKRQAEREDVLPQLRYRPRLQDKREESRVQLRIDEQRHDSGTVRNRELRRLRRSRHRVGHHAQGLSRRNTSHRPRELVPHERSPDGLRQTHGVRVIQCYSITPSILIRRAEIMCRICRMKCIYNFLPIINNLKCT